MNIRKTIFVETDPILKTSQACYSASKAPAHTNTKRNTHCILIDLFTLAAATITLSHKQTHTCTHTFISAALEVQITT
jgi:hypothetical protein